MKKLILLLVYLSLFASADSELLTKAVIKLIQENQAMQSEIRMLKIESERLKKLEFELEKIKKNQGSLLSEKERRQIEIFLKSKKTLEQKQQKQQQDIEAIKVKLQSLRVRENVEITIFTPFTARVRASVLNVRVGPRINYKSIGFLKNGNEIEVIEKSINNWCKIVYRDKLGWVSCKWLTD